MPNPSVEEALRVGICCGLTYVKEAFSNYFLHYNLFFDNAKLIEQELAFYKEAEVRGIEEENMIADALKKYPRKNIVVYHKNCADGFGAATVFYKRFKDEVDYFPGSYTDQMYDLELFRDRGVYLVDFSYKREVVEEIIKIAKFVRLIDHHKSALEDLKGLKNLDFCNSSNEFSGAMLAWRWLFPTEEPPLMIELIQDRDLWKFKYPETKDFSQYLFSLDYDFETWLDTMEAAKNTSRFFSSMLTQGAAIERKHMKDVKELSKYAFNIRIEDTIIPCLNVPYMMASDAGNLLSENVPFAVTYYESGKGVHLSFRSQPEGADVSQIAFRLGGGGHKNASGATIRRELFDSFKNYEPMPLN